jgi:hypothetical protein
MFSTELINSMCVCVYYDQRPRSGDVDVGQKSLPISTEPKESGQC